jgi:hypothetical protein
MSDSIAGVRPLVAAEPGQHPQEIPVGVDLAQAAEFVLRVDGTQIDPLQRRIARARHSQQIID